MNRGSDDQAAFLGRYRIERELGRGGMGEVLLATDTLLGRRVALKRLLATGVPDPSDRALARATILKEARRASRISDPHIAAIHDVLDLEDEVVLVMEYIDGETLRQRMRRPVSLEAFWDLAPQCVEGMAVAHAHGVVHRDLKPENLMITRDGVVKILDFGIATRDVTSPGITSTATERMTGSVAGTPQYMAPEALLGGVVDGRTDIFALGAVFYEMLTSRKPFEGETYAAVVDRVLNEQPAAVITLNPAAGPALSEVVTRMLAKKQEERFATTTELETELNRARSGLTPRGVATEVSPAAVVAPAASSAVATPAPGPIPAPAARAGRGWVVPAVAVLVAVALVVGWSLLAPPPFPKEPNLAVLPPPAGTDAEFTNFGLGAVDLLSKQLRRHTISPPFQMAPLTDFLNEKVQTVADTRRMLGANLALLPTIERDGDVLHARLELFETVHGRLIARRKVEAPATELFEFLDRTYRAAAELLRLEPRGGMDSGIHGPGTLRFYLQGTGRLRATTSPADAELAVAEFETACRTDPDGAVARAGLANAQLSVYLRGNGDSTLLVRAEAIAREAVGLDSSRADAHRVLASVLATERHNAEALEEYARASGLDPSDLDMALRRARMYNRLHQPEREREAYLAIVAERPNAWQPYWWLGSWNLQHGRLDEAVDAYRQMTSRAPDYFLSYSNLGGALLQRGDYAAAIDTLRRSLAIRPTQAVFQNLGTAYFNTGRFQEAADAYNQSFQFGTAGYVSWFNLGDAYSWLERRKPEAAKAYAQGISLGREEIAERVRSGGSFDPTIPAALAVAFARLGEADSARIYLGRAVSADSANYRVAFCSALTCWELGDRPRAIAWLQKSVQGGYPTAWLRDSQVFAEWRALPEFRALVGEAPGPGPARR